MARATLITALQKTYPPLWGLGPNGCGTGTRGLGPLTGTLGCCLLTNTRISPVHITGCKLRPIGNRVPGSRFDPEQTEEEMTRDAEQNQHKENRKPVSRMLE